jgi:hypothetical protein
VGRQGNAGWGIARCLMRVSHGEGTASAGFLPTPAQHRRSWDRCPCIQHWMQGDESGLWLPYPLSRVSATVTVTRLEDNSAMSKLPSIPGNRWMGGLPFCQGNVTLLGLPATGERSAG